MFLDQAAAETDAPVPTARIEMDGVPAAMATRAPTESALASLARSAHDALDDGLLLIALPAIRPEHTEPRRRKRRRKENAE